MSAAPQREFVFYIAKTNVSPQVEAAFWDPGLPAAVPDTTKTIESDKVDATRPAPEGLSAEKVEEMLQTPENWRLAVSADGDDDVPWVLTKEDLQKQKEEHPRAERVPVKLRPLAPSEKLLLDSTSKLFSPEASMDRLKEAVALPVTQAGLVATAAGLFGLLALRDKIAHVWLMDVAVVAAALAIGVSLVGRYKLKEVRIKPGRLDLLEQQHEETINGSIERARIGLALLLAAIAFALASTIPWFSGKSASASISISSVEVADGKTTATVSAAWSHLGDSVDRVVTVVRDGDKKLIEKTTPTKSEASVSQELKFDVGTATVVEVTTHALAKSGDEVGTGATKRLTVPKAGG